MARILVVEDEISIQKILMYDLKQAGYEVITAGDGLLGYNLASDEKFDLILLDIMLPKMNGIEVCEKLRSESNETPIIMLTAMDDEFDKISGLNVGADDYVTKPFSPRELLARIKAVLRRQKNKAPVSKNALHFKGIVLHPSKYKTYYNDELLELTLKEFELLEYFIRNQGIALSREQLLSNLWGFSYDGDSRIVDVHVFKLRDKLTETKINIKTIRGIGYLLEE